jgi:tetratricopeptide (TPR) repeat protein
MATSHPHPGPLPGRARELGEGRDEEARTLTTQANDLDAAQARHQQGVDWLDQRSGRRDENIERAIEHLCFALEVYDRCDRREQWAKALNDLARAYKARLRGDPARNQEEAIRLYREAQSVYTRQAYPREWAIVQFNLGNTFLRRIAGRRAENHADAERCYCAALEVLTRESTPHGWALLHNGLGVFYLEAVSGNRAENLEAALACFERALEVFEPERRLADWAGATYNMGAVYRHRLRGSRAENLETAIACYQAALARLAPAGYQYLQADAHYHLGVGYTERLRGNRVENLQQAGEHLSLALIIYQEAGLTAEAAQTQLRLSDLRLKGQVDDQATGVEEVIRDLTQLEATLDKAASPFGWANVELSLGNAYVQRVRGDRAQNVEAAIGHFEEALTVFRPENAPAEWSYAQIGLAAAYRQRPTAHLERPAESRLANLSRAIGGLGDGLGALQANGWLADWARVQNNLAGACWDRGRYYRDAPVPSPEAETDFRRAVACAEAALTFYTEGDYPFEWALAHHAMGNALSDQTAAEGRAARWRQALTHFEAALRVFDSHYPLQRAWALNDYGVTLLDLAGAAPGAVGRGDLQGAVERFQQAIQTHRDSGLRTELLRSVINLGALYRALGEARLAYAELRRAVEIIEGLRADALSEPGHVHVAGQYTRAYEYLVDTCVTRGESFWPEALEWVEASKGRSFLAAIGGGDYLPPPDLPEKLKRDEASSLQSQREIEMALRDLETSLQEEQTRARERRTLLRRQEAEMARYEELLDEMEPLAPEYVALRRGEAATYAALQSFLDGAGRRIGVVELFPTQRRLLTFVMRSGWAAPRLAATDLDAATLEARHLEPFRPVVEAGLPGRLWMKDLGERLFGEALNLLGDVELVYLIPSDGLYALPLHALPVNGQPLLRQRPIAYAPSLAVLARVVARARQRGAGNGRPALVVANPASELAPPLPDTEPLAREVAARFGARPLLGDEATKEAVLERLPTAEIVFFACHGDFDERVSLNSRLYLAGKDVLTVREIMALRLSAELVVLTACETGQSLVRAGDDLVGLSRAFLHAGASAVVVALWRVNVASAIELMHLFFERLYPTGVERGWAALALQESCLKLQKNFPDFFDWSPFIVVGDWA